MEKHNQVCGDEALLLWYAAGALEEKDSSRIAAHLRQCSRCSQQHRENEELIRLYRSMEHEEGSHPTPQELTALAEARSHSASLEDTQQHAAGCHECGEILQVLRKIQKDQEVGGLFGWLRVTAGRVSTKWSQIATRLPSPLVNPIPAYLLILLMAYPAYLGLSGLGDLRQRMADLESPALLTSPLPLETDAQRGAGVSSVTIHSSGNHEVLTFFVPIAPERYRYRVELTHRNARVFLAEDAKSFDGVGTFALLLPKGALSPGDYELVVKELERQAVSDQQQTSTVSFSFTVSPR